MKKKQVFSCTMHRSLTIQAAAASVHAVQRQFMEMLPGILSGYLHTVSPVHGGDQGVR
jgi:hypothetical protein